MEELGGEALREGKKSGEGANRPRKRRGAAASNRGGAHRRMRLDNGRRRGRGWAAAMVEIGSRVPS